MKKDVFKIETGSRGEIEFVGDVQIEGNLGDWCKKYFRNERDEFMDECEDEEEREGWESYRDEFFTMVEVFKDEVYSMSLGEERIEYYIDMNSEMFKRKVKEWKEKLGILGDWSDLEDDMVWDFICELDDLSW